MKQQLPMTENSPEITISLSPIQTPDDNSLKPKRVLFRKDSSSSDENFEVSPAKKSNSRQRMTRELPIIENSPEITILSSPIQTQVDNSLKAKRVLFRTDFSSSDENDSLQSLDDCDEPPATENYDNDPLLPIFCAQKSGIKTKEAVEILIKKQPQFKLAKTIPYNINQNVTFVYSIDSIGHWKNALCDNMGRWNQKGTDKQFFKVEEEGNIIIEKNDTYCDFSVIRRKYQNYSSNSLHRVMITVENLKTGNMLDQILVQYYFDGEERDIQVAPHGNSKQYSSYQRTQETTKQRIKELCQEKKSGPKNVMHSMIEEQNGLEQIRGSSYIPRDRQQVSNLKRKFQQTSDKDPLLECIDLAKQQEKTAKKFVRDVRAGPEFTMFLCTDRQPEEMNKFCTNLKNFSVVGIDTTFNIGKYYVTIITYRHLMLKTSKGTEPVITGPILLHQKQSFDSFFKLSSGLVQENKNLLNLKVFGTDGDVNLSDAFSASFPDSLHLLCDLHMFDNIERQLRKLGITGHIARTFTKDIFGMIEGTNKIKGLVDSMSQEEFDSRLKDLKHVWIDRHSQGQSFYNYFVEYKSELIKKCMSAEVRTKCGLEFPPKIYTQNANECMHSVLKGDISKSKGASVKLDAYEFAKEAEKFIRRQETEIKMAIIGKGEYKLKEEYQELFVDENSYWRKSESQREAVYRKFQRQPIKISGIEHDEDLTATSSAIIFPVSEEESQIVNVPFRILSDICRCAKQLLSEDGNITLLPGCKDGKLFMVANFISNNDPHILEYQAGPVTICCDKKCSRYISFNLCQHTLALSQYLGIFNSYLNSYRKKYKDKCDVTNLANANMATNRGKKASKATQRRKGAANKTSIELQEYVEKDIPTQDQPFHLTFCAGLIRKCYGCNQEFSKKHRKSPHDLLLKRYDFRSYFSPKSNCQKTSKNMQSTYFHFSAECARRLVPRFEMTHVIVHNEIKEQLKEGHKEILDQHNIKY
ncbi:unnamed protein product [Mytilus edulis]|uniref:Uncharacterized protein n=1 Tax=Mytilus edulis TaxID=6550 RepID=A0A8S3UWF6_MYTED|nr:unnamed protein product [Mytilus edulis]